ncbi:MAG: hypothetical protein HYX49_07540 [Chloroflexi bacterium]|nr:hypothetical protein [Chloroflexota bacterium]
MNMKWAQRLFLVLIVMVSLYASIQTLISTKDLGSASDDPVADWETRFAPLKERLPFQRGVVGYISDSSIPGVSYDAANNEGEYVLVQYVMSPIIIVKGTDQEWNIGNLSREAYKIWSQSNVGQFEVFAFKGNIYLFHKVSK